MKRFFTVLSIIIMAAACKTPDEARDETRIVIDNIMSRKSVRSYTSQSVPDEMVQTLLKAAMAAPSAMNRQPWEFIVVNDRDLLDSMAANLKYAKMLAEAPLGIVVCATTQLEKDDGSVVVNRLWVHDACAATENLLLAAEALGLGAVWTAAYEDERAEYVSKTLGLPSNVSPLCVVAVGWPNGEFQPKDKWKPEKIHWNRW